MSFLTNISTWYNQQPEWFKVLCWVSLSATVTETIKALSDVKIESVILMGAINVALVVLRSMQKSYLASKR